MSDGLDDPVTPNVTTARTPSAVPAVSPSQRPFAFPQRLRLRRREDFAAAYKVGRKRHRGPLTVFLRPNGLDHPRFASSVSRKVGNSVVRHRIKRLLREAFRLNQTAWPAGTDLLVVVRPHEPMSVDAYVRLLLDAAASHPRAP